MSVFWGLGINCLIEFFKNDIEKIVHAFYPLFKTWVQQDYHNLKKLSDLSISIRRCVFIYKYEYVSFCAVTTTLCPAIPICLDWLLLRTHNAICGISGAWPTKSPATQKYHTWKTQQNQML